MPSNCAHDGCGRLAVSLHSTCYLHMTPDSLDLARVTEALRNRTLSEPPCLELVPLADCDLSGVDLSGAHLAGADLSRADLSRARFVGADMRRLRLAGSRLERANLQMADLRGADLEWANLARADLSDAMLDAAFMRRSTLSEARLDGAILRGANLSGAQLDGSVGVEILAPRAVLADANLNDVVWPYALLGGVDLTGCAAVAANLECANLVGAQLSNIDLRRASMRLARVACASLRAATLMHTDLRGAILREVAVHGARLEDAVCHSTRFDRVYGRPLPAISAPTPEPDPPLAIGNEHVFEPRRSSPRWFIQRFTNASVRENGYVVIHGESAQAVIVDPGGFPAQLRDSVAGRGCEVAAVLLTHTHPDHVAGLRQLVATFDVPIYVPSSEISVLADALDHENTKLGKRLVPVGGDEHFTIDRIEVRAFHSRGHTRGSCTYAIGASLFTGDALMAGAVGATPNSETHEKQRSELLAMLEQMSPLAWVYPGHGPATSSGIERLYNPFLTVGPNAALDGAWLE